MGRCCPGSVIHPQRCPVLGWGLPTSPSVSTRSALDLCYITCSGKIKPHTPSAVGSIPAETALHPGLFHIVCTAVSHWLWSSGSRAGAGLLSRGHRAMTGASLLLTTRAGVEVSDAANILPCTGGPATKSPPAPNENSANAENPTQKNDSRHQVDTQPRVHPPPGQKPVPDRRVSKDHRVLGQKETAIGPRRSRPFGRT